MSMNGICDEHERHFEFVSSCKAHCLLLAETPERLCAFCLSRRWTKPLTVPCRCRFKAKQCLRAGAV